MVSLLIAAIHAAALAGGWAIGGTAGLIGALVVVVAVERRLVRHRALSSRHRTKEHRAHR